MAYTCILGRKCECDGCMQCQEEHDYDVCNWCQEKHLVYDLHYVNGEFLCDDCFAEAQEEEEEE